MKKIVYFTVLAIVLVLNIIYAMMILNGKHGWDAEIYCNAVKMEQNGLNPYLGNQGSEQLTWNYLPVYLMFFKTVCISPLNFTATYPIIYFVALVGCVLLWLPGRDWLLAFTLGSCSFMSFVWNLQTGNIGVLELLLLSIAFLGLSRKKWGLASFLIGLMASFKLLTILYLPLIFLAPIGKKSSLKAFALGLIGFILPVALSFAFYPNLAPWFPRQLLGLIPGQHSPILESGNSGNPALVYLIAQLFSVGEYFTYVLLVTVILALFFTLAGIILWRRIIVHMEPSQRFYFAYGLAFLAVTLLFPRMKPYSFILVTPSLFWLARMEGYKERTVILVFSALLPIVILLASPWLPNLRLVTLLMEYNLAISLLLTTLVVIVIRWKPPTLPRTDAARYTL